MQTVYIAVISHIDGINRKSYSSTIPEYLIADAYLLEQADLERGIQIKPTDDLPTNHPFNLWVGSLKFEGNWMNWMDKWNTATLYLLYVGETSFSM
jgi:hypothetical protein